MPQYSTDWQFRRAINEWISRGQRSPHDERKFENNLATNLCMRNRKFSAFFKASFVFERERSASIQWGSLSDLDSVSVALSFPIHCRKFENKINLVLIQMLIFRVVMNTVFYLFGVSIGVLNTFNEVWIFFNYLSLNLCHWMGLIIF